MFCLLAMLARQNRIDTANVPAPTCKNQLIIMYQTFFARSLRSLAKLEITPLLIITSLTWNNEPKFYVPYFPYKREVIFFARSLRSLAKLEITPLLIITSLTWNNEPKFYVPYFPYKREVIFFCSLVTLARQNRNNTAFNNHVPDMEQ